VDPLKALREIQSGKGSAIPGEAKVRQNGRAILIGQDVNATARR
jgi:hypothetical protein